MSLAPKTGPPRLGQQVGDAEQPPDWMARQWWEESGRMKTYWFPVCTGVTAFRAAEV